jgi:DNA-binding MarR family transcriptional regulator
MVCMDTTAPTASAVRAKRTRWLSAEQQRVWRAYLVGTTLLTERLDRDLREKHDLSLPEYEVLVRLSETPDGRLRMAELADSLSHSRSRVTHTVARMEVEGLIIRTSCPSDRRGVIAEMTDKGFDVLRKAAHTHVTGVREYLVDTAGSADFAAVGRVFDSVADNLVSSSEHPATDNRPPR